jgi:hypothetical protein
MAKLTHSRKRKPLFDDTHVALISTASTAQREGEPAFESFTMQFDDGSTEYGFYHLKMSRAQTIWLVGILNAKLAQVHDGKGGIMTKPQDGG